MESLFKRLLADYNRLPEQAEPFRRLAVLLNAMIPVLCLFGLAAGGILAWRRNRWGYYIVLVCALGLAAEVFIFGL